MKKTLYQYLEVEPTASAEEIIQICQKRIDQYEALKEKGEPKAASLLLILKDAQRVLLDPEKRQLYDLKLSQENSYNELPSAITKNAFNRLFAQVKFVNKRKHLLLIAAAIVLTGATYSYFALFAPKGEAKDAVRNALIDPDSAKFKNVVVRDRGVVCGEMNAKNKMGGYSGYTKFVYYTEDSVLLLQNPEPENKDERLTNELIDYSCS
jgi:curved DNA-binding protein CbpA